MRLVDDLVRELSLRLLKVLLFRASYILVS